MTQPQQRCAPTVERLLGTIRLCAGSGHVEGRVKYFKSLTRNSSQLAKTGKIILGK